MLLTGINVLSGNIFFVGSAIIALPTQLLALFLFLRARIYNKVSNFNLLDSCQDSILFLVFLIFFLQKSLSFRKNVVPLHPLSR